MFSFPGAPLAGEAATSDHSEFMIRQKKLVPVKVTWRMTGANAVLVDIDLTEPYSDTNMQFGSPDRGWLESSRDLLHGLQVRETPMDSLPADLVEAFTRPKR